MSEAPFLIVGGLLALVVGAEVLVRGGSGLAAWLGIRPMVVGLTVVSLGTSVPELAVGIDAAVTGSPGLAVGNIVGTNLVNVLLILGMSALLIPVAFQRQTLVFDLPAMTVAALALLVLSLDGTLTRIDGLLLLAGAVAYTWALLRLSRRDAASEPASDPVDDQSPPRPLRHALALLAGMAVIVREDMGEQAYSAVDDESGATFVQVQSGPVVAYIAGTTDTASTDVEQIASAFDIAMGGDGADLDAPRPQPSQDLGLGSPGPTASEPVGQGVPEQAAKLVAEAAMGGGRHRPRLPARGGGRAERCPLPRIRHRPAGAVLPPDPAPVADA